MYQSTRQLVIVCVTVLLCLGVVVAGLTIAGIHSDQMQTDQKIACVKAGGGFEGGTESDTRCTAVGNR